MYAFCFFFGPVTIQPRVRSESLSTEEYWHAEEKKLKQVHVHINLAVFIIIILFFIFFHDYCHVYNLYQVKISTFNTLTDVVGLLFDRGV